VRDEDRILESLADIKKWKAETIKRYQHTIEPLAALERAGKTAVTCRLAGNFPGSPSIFQFVFHLEGGKITSLEIR